MSEELKRALDTLINLEPTATPAGVTATGQKPRGWLATTGSDCTTDMYWRLEDAQRDCDQHNAYVGSQPDFEESELRFPEPVWDSASATSPAVGQDDARDAVLEEAAEACGVVAADGKYGEEGTAAALDCIKNVRDLMSTATASEPVTAKCDDASVTYAHAEAFRKEYEIRVDEGVYTLTEHDHFVLNNFLVDLFEDRDLFGPVGTGTGTAPTKDEPVTEQPAGQRGGE